MKLHFGIQFIFKHSDMLKLIKSTLYETCGLLSSLNYFNYAPSYLLPVAPKSHKHLIKMISHQSQVTKNTCSHSQTSWQIQLIIVFLSFVVIFVVPSFSDN